MRQVESECTEGPYKVWDTEFGKVYSARCERLPMIGEVSFLWSGLVEKTDLRRLLDQLFEDALVGRTDPGESIRILEEAYYQK
jgi:hypothetical protein